SACTTKHTPKKHVTGKGNAVVTPSVPAGVSITAPAPGKACQLSATGQTMPDTTLPPYQGADIPVYACVDQAATPAPAPDAQPAPAPATAEVTASSSDSSSTDGGYPYAF